MRKDSIILFYEIRGWKVIQLYYMCPGNGEERLMKPTVANELQHLYASKLNNMSTIIPYPYVSHKVCRIF